MKEYLSQPERMWLMIFEGLIFWLICSFVLSSVVIPTNGKGFYFYTGLIGLILGARIATPFFVRPADVFANALPALVAVFLAPISESNSEYVGILQAGLITYYGLILIFSIIVITFKDTQSAWLKFISNFLKSFVEKVGSPFSVFGSLTFFALYAFHFSDAREFLILALAAIFLIVLSPIETVWLAIKSFRKSASRVFSVAETAEIIALQLPGIIVSRSKERIPAHGELLLARDYACASGRVVALDSIGRDDGMLFRSLIVPGVNKKNAIQASTLLPEGAVSLVSENELIEISGQSVADICGLVSVDTSVFEMKFEVTNPNGLSLGRLVNVEVNGVNVLYQVTNGWVKEEVVQQKNTFGFIKAFSRQVGVWDQDSAGFKSLGWVPSPNAPVFIAKSLPMAPIPGAIGFFPGSNFPVAISDLDSLITHNSAILGVLGVGKSSLALILIERMLREGKKVLVIDITGQYSSELAPYIAEGQQNFTDNLSVAANTRNDVWDEHPSLGGSFAEFKRAVSEEVQAFLDDSCTDLLRIVDPFRLNVTKQFSEPKNVNVNGSWVRSALLYPVTPVEVTRVISEAALDALSSEFSLIAKLCLVYEEAHSLIPEWSSVVADGDKSAVAGTARAILQGRKYGLGCMVISQRTANVTKSILNQCSTVFAMRSFDDTSKDFLSNYIGSEYSSLLPQLQDRHAVVFGRASSCVNPVLMNVINRNAT